MCAFLVVGALLVAAREGQTGSFVLPLVFTAAVPAALSIVLIFTGSPPARKAALLLFFTSLLCIAGVLMFQHTAGRRGFFGIEEERVAEITGRVIEDGQTVSSGRARTVLLLESATDGFGNRGVARGRLAVICRRSFSPGRGSLIRLEVRLSGPSGDTAGGQYVGFARSKPELLRGPPVFQRYRLKIFHYLLGRIRSIGKSSSGLLEALILGYGGAASEQLYELFRKSGNAHLLALSGMHLGIITLGILWMLLPVFGRKRGVFISLIVILLYLLLVGPRPSLVRAVLMYGIGSLGFLLYGEKPDLLHLLVMTFLVQGLTDPESAYTLGFQLSYLALVGIILWSGSIELMMPYYIPAVVRKVLAAGLAAQLTTSFLLVRVFGVLYPFGIFTVLFLSPMIMLWMWTGIVYVVWSVSVGLLHGPGIVLADRLLRKGIEQAAEGTVRVVELGASFPSVRIDPGQWAWVALGGGALLTLLAVCRYAGSNGANRKLQLSRGNQAFPLCTWNGSNPPLWAEFPDLTAGEREDTRAA